jgi:UDP-2,3-diacylglucosamine pyrophosphatase LpxH
VYDAVIISDIHLGSDNCQAKSLCSFLEDIESETVQTSRLILNGDVFDSIDFRRLKKNHWKVLSLIRKLSDRMEIIWLCGNHDASAELFSNLLGTTVMEEYVLHSGGRDILILHGHVFDDFLDAHPWISFFSDMAYFLLQRIDRTHRIARFAKKTSKKFLRCADKIEEQATAYARKRKCSAVCCGHTHNPVSKHTETIAYFNSGCWTEAPSHYLAVRAGVVDLNTFDAVTAKPLAEVTRGSAPVEHVPKALTAPAPVSSDNQGTVA